MKAAGRFHHGDLRAAMLAVLAEIVAADGTEAVSLREVARRTGVSHSAATHHFGDKTGLFTAFAAEGFVRLADAMAAAHRRAGDDPVAQLQANGEAYVAFATAHPGHFAIMFRSGLLRRDDPALAAASAAAYRLFADRMRARAGGAGPGDLAVRLRLAWSAVHGFAALWNEGPMRAQVAEADPVEAARPMIARVVADAGR